jgi:glycosyltransferase involved in cell wall biosynthesis
MIAEKPLVTVLINNYNYGRFLSDAIDSVLNQTYPHIEIIVVDDGSTDESREVISSYGERIISLLKENGGQASAFNAGFSKSRGEIVIFLDADDYLFPEAVEQVVAAWKPDVVKVQYRLECVDGLKNPIGFYPEMDVSMDSGDVLPILLKKGRYITPVTSGNSFSRTALNKIFPVPETEFCICADAYLVNLIPFYGQIVSIEKPLAAYRIHGNNSWSKNEFGAEQLRKSVEHDLQKYHLIKSKADECKYKTPKKLGFADYTHLRPRLASLRLDPQNHPVPSDLPLNLAVSGVWAIWRYSDFNLRKRFTLSMWFIWVGILPLPIAKLAITRLDPKSGIRPLSWMFKKQEYQVKV